jgi:hypothetical protein
LAQQPRSDRAARDGFLRSRPRCPARTDPPACHAGAAGADARWPCPVRSCHRAQAGALRHGAGRKPSCLDQQSGRRRGYGGAPAQDRQAGAHGLADPDPG